MNADHPITFSREADRIEVLFEGHEIADSADVLLLNEADYAPVRYFPRSDVAMAFLRKTDKVTRCPYKGDATYYTIVRDGQIIENAVWSYETPLPGVSEIAGRLAFYPQHVEFKRVDLTAAETRNLAETRDLAETAGLDVNEVVKHTDSGSGSSQAEHWKANVSMPDEETREGDDVSDKGGLAPVSRLYGGTGPI
ncbi:hypothetical protein BH10PSE3_BH10PSE3_19060 [soil metagenome]